MKHYMVIQASCFQKLSQLPVTFGKKHTEEEMTSRRAVWSVMRTADLLPIETIKTGENYFFKITI